METLLTEYRRTMRFLWRIRVCWIVAAALLGLLIALTWIVAAQNDELREAAFTSISQVFESKQIYEEDTSSSTMKLEPVRLIFSNTLAMGLSFVMGFVPLLFVPLFSLVVNSAVIGFLGSMMGALGISPGLFFLMLLPHGIFEVPAMVLSYGMGLYLCAVISVRILRPRRAVRVGAAIAEGLRGMVLVVFPLVILAGITESYITPFIMGLLLK